VSMNDAKEGVQGSIYFLLQRCVRAIYAVWLSRPSVPISMSALNKLERIALRSGSNFGTSSNQLRLVSA
jgi:hypothetical protein